MNKNDINHLDPDDIGLKQVMGNRFQDATKPMVEPIRTKSTNTVKEEKKVQKAFDKAMDAQWEPARPEPNWTDNLKACCKAVAVFGGLSLLVFYWKEAGLMAESIAVPCIATCTALAGWGAGRSIKRGL